MSSNPSVKPEKESRYIGSLLGLAAGDAVGAAVEFMQPGTFQPVADMLGGGPFDLAPGEWTDDTSMALCLAESLVLSGGFDPWDQMDRYVRWYTQGYMSCKGYCFDIGNATREALEIYVHTRMPYCGSDHPLTAGNGSLMRLAPVPLYFAGNPLLAIENSARSSRTTHAADEAVDACRFMAGLLVGAVHGAEKEELLSPLYCPVPGLWERPEHRLAPAIRRIAEGSYREAQPPVIRGSGYVVHTLESALWAFYHTESFAEGLLQVVNLGEDADTTGAVYGQLAGAYYGAEAIPAQWRERLALRERIEGLAKGLLPA